MKRTTPVAIVILAVFAAMQVRANYYVAQNGQEPVHPYISWANAASNIQDAASAVGADDVTIWVGAGHYGPPPNAVDWNGPNVVYLDRPVTLRSSNNVPASVIIDGHGTHRGIAVVAAGTVIISGITVTNGYSAVHGGGIRTGSLDTTLVVSNSVVVGNYSGDNGGGIWSFGDLTLINSRVAYNEALAVTAFGGGGGIWVRGSCKIFNSHITHNKSYAEGDPAGAGGLLPGGETVIENSTIAHNRAVHSSGGGILVLAADSDITIVNSIIEYNRANDGGGGLYRRWGTTTLENVVFRGNQADSVRGTLNYRGNAIWSRGDRAGSALVLKNCLIVENHGEAACAIFSMWSYYDIRLYNCTVAYNDGDGASYNNVIGFRHHDGDDRRFHIYNSILYHNKLAMQVPAIDDLYLSHNCTESDLSASPGGNHVLAPPEFANAAQGDYRLAGTSPCIDAGNNDYVQTEVDLGGKQRIDPTYGRVDIGAYEYIRPGTILLLH